MLRVIIIGILLSVLICYLEWGGDNSAFLFQIEYTLMFGEAQSYESFLHPFVLTPLFGQLILLFTALQRVPNRRLIVLGIVLSATLVLLILTAGILSRNIRVVLSTLPFILFTIWYFVYRRRMRLKTV